MGKIQEEIAASVPIAVSNPVIGDEDVSDLQEEIVASIPTAASNPVIGDEGVTHLQEEQIQEEVVASIPTTSSNPVIGDEDVSDLQEQQEKEWLLNAQSSGKLLDNGYKVPDLNLTAIESASLGDFDIFAEKEWLLNAESSGKLLHDGYKVPDLNVPAVLDENACKRPSLDLNEVPPESPQASVALSVGDFDTFAEVNGRSYILTEEDLALAADYFKGDDGAVGASYY